MNCAPTATRTRDLLLRRHSRSVARRCRTSPDVPFRRSDNGWTWPAVALRLWSLAPSLAPSRLVSAANVRSPDTSPTTSRRTTRRRTGTAARPPTPPGDPAPGTSAAPRTRPAIRRGKSRKADTEAASKILITPCGPQSRRARPPASDAKLPPMHRHPEGRPLADDRPPGGGRPPGTCRRRTRDHSPGPATLA